MVPVASDGSKMLNTYPPPHLTFFKYLDFRGDVFPASESLLLEPLLKGGENDMIYDMYCMYTTTQLNV